MGPGGPGGGAEPRWRPPRRAGNPRERLAASARELERLAAAAQSPVRLRLESDGQTQVVIYRVGQYGTFATRDVELLPGRYTVVGTRNGFRDVRREVVLPPGAAPAAVVVQMRGADLKDVWLEDPLGERKLRRPSCRSPSAVRARPSSFPAAGRARCARASR